MRVNCKFGNYLTSDERLKRNRTYKHIVLTDETYLKLLGTSILYYFTTEVGQHCLARHVISGIIAIA